MKIRLYVEKDIERIIELYNETTKEINWNDLNEEQKKVMLFKDVKVAHELMNSNITCVLEDENEIRGLAMMTQEGYIRFLYVDIRFLRKGYGRKLLSAMEEKAKGLGLEKVYLHTSKYTSDNKIYEKLGYQNKGGETYTIVGVEFVGSRMEKNLN